MRAADCPAQDCGHREKQNIHWQNKPPLCPLVTGLIVRSGTNEEWKCASSKTFPPSPMHRIQVRKSPELGSQELFVLPRPSSCLHLCLALRDLHILHVACALSAPLSLNNLTKRNCDAANEGCAPHKPPSACKGLQKEENANKLEGKKDVSSFLVYSRGNRGRAGVLEWNPVLHICYRTIFLPKLQTWEGRTAISWLPSLCSVVLWLLSSWKPVIQKNKQQIAMRGWTD